MSFYSWCDLVLLGVGGPSDVVNHDSLTAWANAETAPYDLMRWNNPLNTTWKMPGSVDSGAQPGAHDVQIYVSEAQGAQATINTLLNGLYPTIVLNLRNSLPSSDWMNAATELNRWGTGTGWIGGSSVATIDDVYNLLKKTPQQPSESYLAAVYSSLESQNQLLIQKVDALQAKVDAIATPKSGTWQTS